MVEKLKTAGRWLKEALGMHFEATWEASGGVESEFGYLVGARGPQKGDKSPYKIDIRE